MVRKARPRWAITSYAGGTASKPTRHTHIVNHIADVGLAAIEWRIGSRGSVPGYE